MNNVPKVSIIVPIYNVEKYLEKCLKSIINQTYKNIEIILINDGSTDACKEICEKFKQEYDNKNIILIHKLNGGLSDARNVGIQNATGEYVSFVDSDDFIEIDMIEKMVSKLSNDIDVVMCGKYINYENGIEKKVCEKKEQILTPQEAIVYINSFNAANMSAWGKLFKLENVKKKLFPVGKTSEDCFVMCHYLGNANTVCIMNDAFYHYVQRANSISRGKKINFDFIDGHRTQKEYIDKNYKDISYVGNTMYAYSFVTIYNIYIARKLKLERKDRVFFIEEAGKYIGDVLKNNQISIFKKIQFIIFVKFNKLYTGIFEYIWRD